MTDLEETPEPYLSLDFWVINYDNDCVRTDERTCKEVTEMIDLGITKGMWVVDIYGSEQYVLFSTVVSMWHITQDIREKIAAHNKILVETKPASEKFD